MRALSAATCSSSSTAAVRPRANALGTAPAARCSLSSPAAVRAQPAAASPLITTRRGSSLVAAAKKGKKGGGGGAGSASGGSSGGGGGGKYKNPGDVRDGSAYSQETRKIILSLEKIRKVCAFWGGGGVRVSMPPG